jgi:general secretion pathway protein H
MTLPSKATVKGFTLIEMLVVLAILGAALAVTVAALPQRGGGVDLAAAADGVASALRLARARAVAAGHPVAFALAGDGRSYTVESRTQPAPPAVQFSMTGPTAIRFDPGGGSSGGGVRVTGPHRALEVRVDWLTGRVAIAEAP